MTACDPVDHNEKALARVLKWLFTRNPLWSGWELEEQLAFAGFCLEIDDLFSIDFLTIAAGGWDAP